MSELSGANWVKRFPGSQSLDDLEDSFSAQVKNFKAALEAAGAHTNVTSTKRPAERAYLMHWSWRIAKAGQVPSTVPSMSGVDIQWDHGSASASTAAAVAMVQGYGIDTLSIAPSLTSRHVEGKAIDMHVSWLGTLRIRLTDGSTPDITSTPRNSTNADLIAVGKTYGVIHFLNTSADPAHWSTDGH